MPTRTPKTASWVAAVVLLLLPLLAAPVHGQDRCPADAADCATINAACEARCNATDTQCFFSCMFAGLQSEASWPQNVGGDCWDDCLLDADPWACMRRECPLAACTSWLATEHYRLVCTKCPRTCTKDGGGKKR